MIRTLFLLLLAGLLCAALALGYVAWKFDDSLEQPLALEQAQMLEVLPGATPNGLLQRLQEEGVLRDAFWLRLHWRLRLSGSNLHSGEYELRPGMRAAELLQLWQRGEVVQYSLTLVEGWNFRQLRAELARHPKLEQTLADASDAEVMAALGQPGRHPEGQFFPDTYRYVKGSTDIDLLRQALRRMQSVLEEEWAARAQDLPYRDAYQALVMASLVERETGVAEERGQIAGVFVRRLRLGMRLQTDPTVIYGMGERYNGRIGRADLRRPTPYNTYVIDGLPPTPIAMPGREAIHAALHPQAGRSLYFVARGDGSHVFSETLAEHNRAVREYQLRRRSDYRSSPAPAAR